ncbi:unnamed protein product [Mycena citricolor]|uniref:DUF6533 domain-containing protein n=1 Tax=Mycena citricolor TaxID=2018698 RepID=A0AAD2HEJ3_9AGAR|nr:unnamed protein product [Mycena citricolor]
MDPAKQVVDLVADARTTNYLSVALLTIALHEYISTFEYEIRLIWKTRLSLANIIYIRYFTLAAVRSVDFAVMLREQTSDKVCQTMLLVEMASSTLVTVLTDIILALRVWILYHRSRKVLYLFIGLSIMEAITMSLLGYHTIRPLTAYAHLGPVLQGCYSLEVPRLFTFYALPPYVIGLTMFIMTMLQCRSTISTLGWRHTPVMALFLRDGVFWFISLLLVGTVELVLWRDARPTLAQVPVIPGTVIMALIGARVLLNIKEITTDVPVRDISTIEVSDLRFSLGVRG